MRLSSIGLCMTVYRTQESVWKMDEEEKAIRRG